MSALDIDTVRKWDEFVFKGYGIIENGFNTG
jgi:hypothetical protein